MIATWANPKTIIPPYNPTKISPINARIASFSIVSLDHSEWLHHQLSDRETNNFLSIRSVIAYGTNLEARFLWSCPYSPGLSRDLSFRRSRRGLREHLYLKLVAWALIEGRMEGSKCGLSMDGWRELEAGGKGGAWLACSPTGVVLWAKRNRKLQSWKALWTSQETWARRIMPLCPALSVMIMRSLRPHAQTYSWRTDERKQRLTTSGGVVTFMRSSHLQWRPNAPAPSPPPTAASGILVWARSVLSPGLAALWLFLTSFDSLLSEALRRTHFWNHGWYTQAYLLVWKLRLLPFIAQHELWSGGWG